MSLYFNRASELDGIIQLIEKECGFNYGDISGNTTLLKEFTAMVNLALDDYVDLAIKSSGTWQFDDSNHTSDYPIVRTNIISGQQDYPLTTDEDGNLVLDIFRVSIKKTPSGVLETISAIDRQTEKDTDLFSQAVSGVPTKYDKTGNGIIFDYVPNYNATNGIEAYVNREASHFTTSDTTKRPGVPGIHHEYFVLKPSFRYARRNGLANLNDLEKAVIDFEGSERLGVVGKIQSYFSLRPKDEPRRMRPLISNTK